MMSSKEESFIVEDIEEGEISEESQSVEEITEDDFKQDSTSTSKPAVSNSKPREGGTTTSMVWMDDLLKYPVSSNYGSGLHNFAWAQAVQNKPLNEGMAREYAKKRGGGGEDNTSSSSSNGPNKKVVVLSKKNEVCSVVIDDSSDDDEEIGSNKVEEGELEEGEIDLDSEMTANDTEANEEIVIGDAEMENVVDEEVKEQISSIKEILDIVTVNEAEKSFNGVCSQLLRTSLDSLQMISKSGGSQVKALIDQTFAGIQVVNSVFRSMDREQQELNKDDLSSLLAHANNQVPALFSPEKMKEIQDVISTLDSPSLSLNVSDMEVDDKQRVITSVKNDPGILGGKPAILVPGILGEKPDLVLEKGLLGPISVTSQDQNNSAMGSENLKQGSFSRGRGIFGPLLDLHQDHDIDSLPSPTRETPPSLYIRDWKVTGDGNVKSESISKVANASEDGSVHHYGTDAFKVVSSYQQKFGQTSFYSSNQLPSPTPSEDSDGGGGDINGEVSSSTFGNARLVNGHMPPQSYPFVVPHTDTSSVQGVAQAKTLGQTTSAPSRHFRASSKSRDPRLRLANPEVGPLDFNSGPMLRHAPRTESADGLINLRKNKNAGENLADGQVMKKQKGGLTNWEVSRDVQMARGGAWMENGKIAGIPVIDKIQSSASMGIDTRKSDNVGIFTSQRQATIGCSGTEQLPVLGTGTTVSLPSLLKDIAVNPTMLVQLIMEQQRLTADAQKSSNLFQGTTSAFTSSLTPGTSSVENAAPSKSYDFEHKFLDKAQTLSQMNSAGEWGKIHMKPRDPRRILHSSAFQKNESLGSEQFKLNVPQTLVSRAIMYNISGRQEGEQAQSSSLPSHSSPPPDIAMQFTTNPKNLADVLSSQLVDSVYTVTQCGSSSQILPLRAEKVDTGVSRPDSKSQQSGTVSTPAGLIETSRSQIAWRDVEHLFEGYDDQQKAAIQRERTRRIEEQNKMFAAKKLCLVLDLDHTLLNSAKFIEVEPVHEEILRVKEEQDREKPQRHLFRFSHMGMWTKLRPGIWKFLEKASKLFELHLYTMGNKLYATEMAKVLDPTGVLFAGRVISKGDDGDPFDADEKLPKIKDLDGVLGMESAVVIIDDSVKVWPHNKLNLILVERYTYFPCSRRQFGLSGPSLLEIDHDERPEDGTLASSLTVIERIHSIFFSNPSLHEVDVRSILSEEQRKILSGCRILFSRVFPVGEAKPHQHPLWQTAEQFGAVCTTQIDNLVTHVVANSLGTDKVNWAMSTGRFVVHPGWVEASALLYRRANENDFAVKISFP